MQLSLPSEPVIYYECSYGNFRLTYHIPVEQLQRLVAQSDISAKVLEDFPDGVDLTCTEPDYSGFQKRYGYRPPMAPEYIRRAFFALLTSTRDWQNFRGSGLVPAKDMERFAESAEALLRQNQLLEEIPEMPEHVPPGQRQEIRGRRAKQESIAYGLLEQMKMEGIDPDQTLKNQKFSPLQMQAGENPAEFFSKLLMNRGKG